LVSTLDVVDQRARSLLDFAERRDPGLCLRSPLGRAIVGVDVVGIMSAYGEDELDVGLGEHREEGDGKRETGRGRREEGDGPGSLG
jgi:hypothetical protein